MTINSFGKLRVNQTIYNGSQLTCNRAIDMEYHL